MSSSKPGDESDGAVARYVRSGVHSTREVVSFLRRRGVPSGNATRLVQTYQTQGWLDDRAGARLWAGQWARQGYASAAISCKLAAKGFDTQVIDEAINRAAPPSDDEARARAVLAQRAGHASGSPSRARLARALAARGFDADVIARLLGEPSTPDDAQR